MKRRLPFLLVAACALILAIGILQLFKLRFAAGDVYPPYSSLRADPLGTMAFYESLDQLPALSVRRDHSTANKLPDGQQTVYLHLAAPRYGWEFVPEETFHEIDRFLALGGRLVITLFPESTSTTFWTRSPDETTGDSTPAKAKSKKGANRKKEVQPSDQKKKSRRPLAEEDSDMTFVSMKDRWGLEFSFANLERGSNRVYEPARVVNQSALPLPPTLDWHSGIVITRLTNSWQTIYARGTNAVVVERKIGHGTVVIATDSFFLSNEALRKERHADFLAWLIGKNRMVLFDEAHLGVVEGAGVSILMRRYGLYWAVAGLILVAGLFIWKNSFALVPPHPDERDPEFVAGKETAAGFINLLRRSIPRRTLLATCFAEWKKSGARNHSAARVQQAEAVVQAGTRDAIGTYRAICAALERTHNPGAQPAPPATMPMPPTERESL